jgi:hypothetical protein
MPGEHHGGNRVQADHLLDLRSRRHCQNAICAHARVVDKAINWAEFLAQLFHHVGDRLKVCQVEWNKMQGAGMRLLQFKFRACELAALLARNDDGAKP